MTRKISFLTFVWLLGVIPLCWAASAKTISLKDGSVIKGNVLEFSNGKYKIETSNLGIIEVNDANVASITAGDLPAANNIPATTTAPSSNNENFQNQLQQFQSQVMSNQTLMNDIATLAQDEEITKLLADPSIMSDIQSHDPQRIQNNPKIQQLMENPKFKTLMSNVSQQVSIQPKN